MSVSGWSAWTWAAALRLWERLYPGGGVGVVWERFDGRWGAGFAGGTIGAGYPDRAAALRAADEVALATGYVVSGQIRDTGARVEVLAVAPSLPSTIAAFGSVERDRGPLVTPETTHVVRWQGLTGYLCFPEGRVEERIDLSTIA